jgi:hypothetical protein
VELWDLAGDRRLFQGPAPRHASVVALPNACLSMSDGAVRLYHETGESRIIASDGVAIAPDGDAALVATKTAILAIDAAGNARTIGPSSENVTAVGRIEGTIVAGLFDGRIQRVAEGTTIEGQTRQVVTVLSAGPGRTLISGHGDGTIAILDPRSGRVLLAASLDGAINHTLIEGKVLYASSRTGDHVAIDLGALDADYCALMKDVWASSPSLWEQGRAVPRSRPTDHPCAR